ncbi:MAG: PKD domain-containing protein [Candidatus Microsaccharimonas sp.]
MLQGLKLIHHDHSGKLRSHKYTSYLPLVILLLLTAIPLSAYTAFALSPGPESQSISLSGTVAGEPPTDPAVIKEPANQQRFSTSPVTVAGSCPADTLVEIFKNDIFAGSMICSSEGAFSLEVDLLFGQNVLVARVYDALNQAGPDSNIVTVFYDLLPAQSSSITPLDFGGPQLILNTDAVFRGTFPGQELTMPITLLGGVAPFALNIQWGDGSNKVVSRNNNTVFSTAHVFQKPGTYQMSIQATDANGRVAFLSVAAIVNGQPEVVAGSGGGEGGDNSMLNSLLALWPLYVSVVAIVLSFWFGEIREKRMLAKAS